jgi:DNA modification methylase
MNIEDLKNEIICGDSLEVLKTIPDESIDCCITSPPYWGLRDYGTGNWVGGSPECKHQMPRNNGRVTPGDKQSTNAGSQPDTWKTCGKCGATKEDQQIGLEKTPEEYVAKMVEVFREIKRVLKKEGTLWLNLGDTYSATRWTNKAGTGFQGEGSASNVRIEKETGLQPKNLTGIPWLVAFALQKDGWILRQDIIWHKPNPMPESVTDRCTKSHEYIFLLAKSQKYYFDNDAIKEPANYDGRKDTVMKGSEKYKDHIMPNGSPQTVASGRHERWNKDKEGNYIRNKRSVWTVNTKPFKEAHFATFPEDLIIPMVKAGCPEGGIILDPFMGAGTTGVVCKKLGRNYLGTELNPKYVEIAEKRINSIPNKLL